MVSGRPLGLLRRAKLLSMQADGKAQPPARQAREPLRRALRIAALADDRVGSSHVSSWGREPRVICEAKGGNPGERTRDVFPVAERR